jgi:hypothetical protein
MLIKDPEKRPSIEQIIQVKIIKNAITLFDKEFEDKIISEPKGPPKTLVERVCYSL